MIGPARVFLEYPHPTSREMTDKAIDQLLEGVQQRFLLTERITGPFRAYGRMLVRLLPEMDPEERASAFLMLTLAVERLTEQLTERNGLAVELTHILRESLRSDGLCYPPPIHSIAKRLGVSPAEVEAGLTALQVCGFFEEVPPRMLFRRRRFRPLPPGLH